MFTLLYFVLLMCLQVHFIINVLLYCDDAVGNNKDQTRNLRIVDEHYSGEQKVR